MSFIEVRELNSHDEEQFLTAHSQMNGDDLDWLTFVWEPKMSHQEHLSQLSKLKEGKEIPSHFVPATMLYGFIDGEIFGRVNIRHRLNGNLRNRGGHLGYYVLPNFRKKGLGHKMVEQGVVYCREQLGLDELLITCATTNLGSVKIIEKLGPFNRVEKLDTVDKEMTFQYTVQI